MNKSIFLTLITLTASLVFAFNEINDLSNNLDLNDLDPQLNKVELPYFVTDPTKMACCKICKKGKACGNSCINKNYTCHKPPGCACNG